MEVPRIYEALRKVPDPKTGQDVVSLGRIKNLQVEENQVNFSIELDSLDVEQKSELNFACIQAIQEVYPNAEVNVHMIARTMQSQQPTSALPQIKNFIAVASGKGGVGKSTVATNLAFALQKLGARVGLLDADLYGPSIPTMLGLNGQRPRIKEIYGKPRIIPLEKDGMPVMSVGFVVEPEQAVVLRGPRLAGLIKQFLFEVIWPELDYLVIDLPPGTGDVQLSLVQTIPVTGVVMVTTPQEVAVVDAVKAMNMFLLPSINVPILGVVENMSWFTPAEFPDHKYTIFGEGGGKKLAKLSESVLLGQVPLVQGIREGGDEGKPIVLQEGHPAAAPFEKIAKNTARQVAVRHETLEPTRIVKMNQ